MSKKPLDHLVQRADSILDGRAGTLEDWRDALEIYKQAGALGSGLAYAKIATLYARGRGVKLNLETALQYFKKSVHMDCFYNYHLLLNTYVLLGESSSLVNAFNFYESKGQPFCGENDPYLQRSMNLAVLLKTDINFTKEFIEYEISMARLRVMGLIYVSEGQVQEELNQHHQRLLATHQDWQTLTSVAKRLGIELGSFDTLLDEFQQMYVNSQLEDEQERISAERVRQQEQAIIQLSDEITDYLNVLEYASLYNVEEHTSAWTDWMKFISQNNGSLDDFTDTIFRTAYPAEQKHIVELYEIFFKVFTESSHDFLDAKYLLCFFNSPNFDPWLLDAWIEKMEGLSQDTRNKARRMLLDEVDQAAVLTHETVASELKIKLVAHDFLIRKGQLEYKEKYLSLLNNPDLSSLDLEKAALVSGIE